jgi:hypothetical protein
VSIQIIIAAMLERELAARGVQSLGPSDCIEIVENLLERLKRGSFGILLFTMQVRRSRSRSRIDICDCDLAGEQSGHRDASRREHDEL